MIVRQKAKDTLGNAGYRGVFTEMCANTYKMDGLYVYLTLDAAADHTVERSLLARPSIKHHEGLKQCQNKLLEGETYYNFTHFIEKVVMA